MMLAGCTCLATVPVNPDAAHALTSEPINTINGAITFGGTDLAIPAPSFDLAFGRFHNSKVSAGTLGPGWSRSFDWSLASVTNGAYEDRAGDFTVLNAGDGSTYWFFLTNGVYLPPPDANLALAFTSGEYRVTWPGGATAAFDTNGVIQRLTDGFGAGLTFTHSGGQLTQVQHSNGKALTFTYAGTVLTRVDSPSTNLYVTFAYNAGGLLTNATRWADGGGLRGAVRLRRRERADARLYCRLRRGAHRHGQRPLVSRC